MSTKNGQVALIALLVLAVATTVGLALISRGTTNVATTRNAEESTRAFSAAETGIEEALRSGVSGGALVDISQGLESSFGTSYKTTVATVSAAANTTFSFPHITLKGETETVWFVPHKPDGSLNLIPPGVVDSDGNSVYSANTIDVCWGTNTPLPAMVATVLYKESTTGTYWIGKGSYDPDTARAQINNFSAPTATSGGCGDGATVYKQTVTFNQLSPTLNPAVDNLIMLRLRPVYSDTQIAVKGTQALPFQVVHIQSVGNTGSGTTRKIDVYQEYKSPSSIFDAAVYSQGSFVQQ